MKAKRRLTMDAFRAIIRPSITAIEGVEVFDVAFETLLRKFTPVLFEAQVGEYAEPQPVGVWHASSC